MSKTVAVCRFIMAGLFLLCLFEMPYGYYQFVRFVGMVGFLYLGFDERDNEPLKYFWFASAILINPFLKIALGKTIWNIIDVIWATALFVSIKLKKRK